MEHFYKKIDGWFNMENEYSELLNFCNDGSNFVELGAWKGKSTCYAVVELLNNNKKINFFTVDTFEGVTAGSDLNEVNAYLKEDKNILNQFKENIDPIKENFKYLISDSASASNLFEDLSVDVIFIDAGHSYESVKKDIESWFDKMKPSSIMSGHDYCESWPGVIKAVDEFFGKPDKVINRCWFKYIKK
jgi:hypothetical protein